MSIRRQKYFDNASLLLLTFFLLGCNGKIFSKNVQSELRFSSSEACFGDICWGDTIYDGRAQFRGVSGGATAADASFKIQPSDSQPNDVIFAILSQNSERFSVNNEGNVRLTGNLTVDGEISCVDCVDSNSILNSSIAVADLAANSISTPKLIDESVTTPKINPGISGESLMTNSAGNVEWLSPKVQYGWKFEFVGVSEIRLVPVGINSKASILVSNGVDLRSILLSAPLTANLTINGAGGLDQGVEQASTGYDIRLITENDGQNPALLITLAGDPPNLPAGYTYQSEIIWFISNTQGGGNSDIALFIDIGRGRCIYQLNRGIQTLVDAENTAITPIDFSAAIPSTSTEVQVSLSVVNLGAILAQLTDLFLYTDAAGSFQIHAISNLLDLLAVNFRSEVHEKQTFPILRQPSNSLYYRFSVDPGLGVHGLDLYTLGWSLPHRMGG